MSVKESAKEIALCNNDGGGVVFKPKKLWSASKKVQGPITDGGDDFKVSELGDPLGWVDRGFKAEIDE